MKIDEKLVKDWKEAIKFALSLEEKITDRIDYIAKTICETFECNLDTWYFPDESEGGVGDLHSHYSDTNIAIYIEVCGYSELKSIIDKNGKLLNFNFFIPTRWLFEDFEKELKDGKKAFDNKEALKKTLQKTRQEETKKKKEEDVAIIALAKSKLSKRELEAIKRSL